MKDYSVLEGLDNNFMIELRCAYDRGYRQGRDDEWAELQAKQKENEYERGLNDAWRVVTEFLLMGDFDRGMTFSTRFLDELLKMEPKMAVERLKEYEKKNYDLPESMRGEINIGDEVKVTEEDGTFRAIVIRRDNTPYPYHIMYDNGDTRYVEEESLAKTGRHFDDIENLFKKMQDDE